MRKKIRLFSVMFLLLSTLLLLAFGTTAYAAKTTSFKTSDSQSAAQSGWVNEDGKWSYYDLNGSLYINGIFTIENQKFFFDENGVLKAGMNKVNGKLYYFSESGFTPYDGYGAMQSYTGLKTINNSTYFFNSDYSAATGWKTINGSTFYFSSSGKMHIGWLKSGKNIFYFMTSDKKGKTGSLATGWKIINGKSFYFKKSGPAGVKGAAFLGLKKIGKNSFYFQKTGSTGNIGKIKTGWQKSGKYTYYFKPSGKKGSKGLMLKNTIAGTKKRGYAYVDKSGKRITTKAIKLAVKYVKKHTKKSQSKAAKLKACFDYLWKHYTYKRFYVLPDKNTISKNYAEYMLKNKRGNCFCYGATFACIAKVLGYDSRLGMGMIAAAGGGMTPHGWGEVKVNGKWYICDPDMQMNIRSINVYKRTRSNFPYRLTVSKHYKLGFNKAKAVWKKTP